MVASIRTLRVPTATNAAPPRSSYVPQWPTAKGFVYRGRVPYQGARSFVAMRCGYKLPNINVAFKPKIDGVSATFDNIVSVVADVFNILRSDLLSKRKSHAYSHPRQALCLLMKEFTKHSFPGIGRMLKRDHSTVMYGIEQAMARMGKDNGFRAMVEECRARLASSVEVERG